ncbi:MAG: hypothetical protein HY749_15455 [Gammaproteobacteria bacterium]|nr:hypothetical protein [Gammaproteobacteria bacterium]MBI5617338.1 hypothetical protein [Gammaproteobacteria bacterium]
MRIEGYSQLANTALVKVSALQSWSIGQIFSATVIGRGTENSILLDVGGETIRAQSRQPLNAGQQLTLRVVNTVPSTLLSIVASTTPPQDVISSAMNESLPKQLPMNALTAAVSAALTEPKSDPGASTKLADLARTMLKELPVSEPVDTPQTLRKAVAQSGLLLEATLAKQVQNGAPQPPTADLKWQLLQLRAAIADLASQLPAQTRASETPASAPQASPAVPQSMPHQTTLAADKPATPDASRPSAAAPPTTDETKPLAHEPLLPKLGQAVDGALARIETHQLNAANAQMSGQIYAVAEIPVRLANDSLQFVRLEIENEQRKTGASDEPDKVLNVVLEVPVTATQTIAARIRLFDQSVAVTLWSDDAELQQRIQARSVELETNLAAAGFIVGGVHLGRVTRIEAGSRLPSRLIDAKV